MMESYLLQGKWQNEQSCQCQWQGRDRGI